MLRGFHTWCLGTFNGIRSFIRFGRSNDNSDNLILRLGNRKKFVKNQTCLKERKRDATVKIEQDDPLNQKGNKADGAALSV